MVLTLAIYYQRSLKFEAESSYSVWYVATLVGVS